MEIESIVNKGLSQEKSKFTLLVTRDEFTLLPYYPIVGSLWVCVALASVGKATENNIPNQG